MNTVFMKRWMKNQVNQFDVIIVGGGAAGMMAAGTAAQNGLHTLLLEKRNEAIVCFLSLTLPLM